MPKAKRECDGCQECCFLFGISKYESDPWTDCPHQCEGGCDVYEDRPKECRKYLCHWVTVDDDPYFDEDMRPDKTGLVFVTGDYKLQRIWLCFESRPAASVTSPGKELIEKLREKYLVKICMYNNVAKLVQLTSMNL